MVLWFCFVYRNKYFLIEKYTSLCQVMFWKLKKKRLVLLTSIRNIQLAFRMAVLDASRLTSWRGKNYHVRNNLPTSAKNKISLGVPSKFIRIHYTPIYFCMLRNLSNWSFLLLDVCSSEHIFIIYSYYKPCLVEEERLIIFWLHLGRLEHCLYCSEFQIDSMGQIALFTVFALLCS